MEGDTVLVSVEEFNRLEEADALLCALQQVGVDNWSGWGDAHELLAEWNEED